jgi:hypothetical protein
MPWVPPPPKLCSLCQGKVYPVEELHVDGVLYHQNCFRCQTCNKARAATACGRTRRPALQNAQFAASAPRGPAALCAAALAVLTTWVCRRCAQVLTLGEYASHRLSPAERGVAIFCKPHFRQSFLERGRYENLTEEPNAAPPSPAAMAASPYRPSGISLFADDDDAHVPPPPPRRAASTKSAKDFESGFAPECVALRAARRVGLPR